MFVFSKKSRLHFCIMKISSTSNSYSMFSHLIPLYLTSLRIFHYSHLKCIFTAWQMSFSLNCRGISKAEFLKKNLPFLSL